MPRSNEAASGVCVTVLSVTVLLVVFGVGTAAGEVKFTCPPTSKYFFPCNCTGGGEKGLFIRCDNTNLASIAVGLANVRLPIEELRLYKCHIKRLYGDVFRSVLLLNLVLEDTPVEEVEEGVFTPVAETLTVLRFHRAPLQRLPVPAFKPLKNLKASVSSCLE